MEPLEYNRDRFWDEGFRRFHCFQPLPSDPLIKWSDLCVFAVCIKADLDGTMFAYDYCARLACVMSLRQFVSCKLDPRQSYDTLWMSYVKIVRVWMVESMRRTFRTNMDLHIMVT